MDQLSLIPTNKSVDSQSINLTIKTKCVKGPVFYSLSSQTPRELYRQNRFPEHSIVIIPLFTVSCKRAWF